MNDWRRMLDNYSGHSIEQKLSSLIHTVAMPINAKVKIEIINDDSKYENWGLKDLGNPKIYEFFLLAFGNGIIEEARVIGETKGGILVFANLVERGGYRRGQASDVANAKLYQAGDACYPEGGPFIFIAPMAENGERVDFDNYRSEVEAFVRSVESGNTDK